MVVSNAEREHGFEADDFAAGGDDLLFPGLADPRAPAGSALHTVPVPCPLGEEIRNFAAVAEEGPRVRGVDVGLDDVVAPEAPSGGVGAEVVDNELLIVGRKGEAVRRRRLFRPQLRLRSEGRGVALPRHGSENPNWSRRRKLAADFLGGDERPFP